MKHKNLLRILSVTVALLLPLFVAAKAFVEQKNATVVRVKITTYDPRDLFYGQYMTYRFDWNWKDGKPDASVCEGPSCCLCVGKGDIDPEVSLMSCDPKPAGSECRGIIRGSFYGTVFDPGFNRYYVDERHAYPLEQLFWQGTETFRIGLGLSSSGRPLIEKIYINDQSLEEYLQSNGGVVPLRPVPVPSAP